jgi:hypothetical protein
MTQETTDLSDGIYLVVFRDGSHHQCDLDELIASVGLDNPRIVSITTIEPYG